MKNSNISNYLMFHGNIRCWVDTLQEMKNDYLKSFNWNSLNKYQSAICGLI